MVKQKAVVSLGHDYFGEITIKQMENVKKAATALADLIECGFSLTITHSNGVQVSMIHKAMAELRRIYPDYTPAPMCVCSAMSQGYVGYDIQSSLRSELYSRGIPGEVVTILTQVTIDPYDDALFTPTKPIGRIMSEPEADVEKTKGNAVTSVAGGFRRVVPAPAPIRIVEIDTIRLLSESGATVIAGGGGGIPVIEQRGELKGASAVIEKDAIAGLMASELSADALIILTGVDCVYSGFGTKEAKKLSDLTVEEAKNLLKNNEFGENTMKPKIETAVSFLTNNPNGYVLITDAAHMKNALKGKIGTKIHV